MNMLANFTGHYLQAGVNPTRTGNANQVAQPADVYEAADGPFVMACITQPQFRSLCNEVIKRPELLSDERFAQGAGRLANVKALSRILSDVFATMPRDHWIGELRKAGVPAGAVASVAEALSSDLVKGRDTVRNVMHRSAGPYRVLRTPARLHDTEPVPPQGAPELGEHTRDVLTSFGGMSDAEVDELIRSGAARATG
jgi:crotonobetainyl-CoA:carnitine CoA-transferase CaiB-like acyl-CoA transferase